ncbi:hypothetical protein BD779DRAFT_1521688 [Infundibulicybe gibba]|nr:hypothetical protein BD779DRAFT_1521688 [Infundibulicybe gibba]
MSRRSHNSVAHDKRLSKYRVTDEELFSYVLRVAVLSYMMMPKPTEVPKQTYNDAREREYSSRLSALSNFSISDMFKDIRDGPKSVKFPEKLLKVLEQKLQNIAMGKDSAYSDQLLRRTMAKFYGQFMVESFKRQMKENRKIEDLILMFATNATTVLKKEPTLAGDGWKLELNNHMAHFVRMLRECLRSVHHVSPELLARLDIYTAKLVPSQTSSDSGYDSASTSRDRDSISVPSISGQVSDMQLVRTVAALFKIEEYAIQQEGVLGTHSLKSPKDLLKEYQCGCTFPWSPRDFDTDAAWQHWRTQESTQLQQLMVIMVQFNPELAKSTPSEVPASFQTYIPTAGTSRNPSMSSRHSYLGVDDNDEVSLGILSPPHIELLNECAGSLFLDLVRQFYERNDVPLECVPEALQSVTKVMHDIELDKWPIQDVEHLCSVYAGLFNRTDIEPFLAVLEHLRDSGLLERFDIDIGARVGDVQERVRQVAAHAYELKMQELQSAPGVNRALPLLLMTDELEKSAKLLDKRFPEPILGQLDLVSLVIEVQMPHFFADLENSQKRLFESSMSGPIPDIPIQDIFALYRRATTMLEMFSAFCPKGRIAFDITGFFEPYVRQWLANTDNKTTQWVEAAISADKFQAESTEGHSSSIVDLFDSLRSPINFLQDLNWEDSYQEARFFTSLSKTISKAVEQYCRNVESLFLTEMFPRPTDYARQLAIQGEKRVEPFNFQPESCVKLNNVEAARKLLDNMYNQMEADKMADPTRFLFTVKIVIAEGLVPLDGSPSSKLDTFVTLSDEPGNRLAKTRTIYETLNPRWDETFDLSVEKGLWVMVSIRDRALVGKHDTIGRAYICLDPRRFGDFLAHDLWMDLDTQGRVLVRFFFGRAFRSLKRAEADMLRIFIDKMAPFIQQCLSRSVLKTLIKAGPGLDYNKAIGNVTALYRSALGASSSEVQIPLPTGEKPRIRPEELTDVEIEQAILPLFDYFDANLQTLNTYLSDTAKEMVMTRVWKEILTVIEGLLIPPLSDVSSDMKPLSDKEVDIVFKWLKFLRDYFYAGGEGPVPLEVLQNQKYRDVVSIRLYYDWHTDALMEECVRMMQQSLRSSPTMKKRAKSVYSQRNLGTIKERKKEKREEKEVTNGETIMRILRMRSGTSEFIAQQLQIMAAMQAEQEHRAKELEQRKLKRPSSQRPPSQIPSVPPLPNQ